MIYEFKCPNCTHIWEECQQMNDKHVTTCPKCGREKVPSIVTGGGGVCFVDHRNWNPSPGFPDNDRKVNKQANDFSKGKQ